MTCSALQKSSKLKIQQWKIYKEIKERGKTSKNLCKIDLWDNIEVF